MASNTSSLHAARDATEREQLRARVAELGAVNRIADAVTRAATVDVLLDEAADAILDGVGASRASVLLTDADGVMRFRAWRGLSDEYRRATEGHSPWPADADDPQPVLVSDVLECDFEPELAETIEREGVRALAFIPLVHDRRLLGKFMVYYDVPHDFGVQEVRVCTTIANHLASSAVRFQARQQLRESLALVDSLFQAAPAGLAYWDRGLRYVRVNDAFAELKGVPMEELVGRYVFDVFPALEPQLGAPLRGVLETGEPALGLLVETGADDGAQFLHASFYPVRGEHDEIVGVGGVVTDVTAERLAQRAAEERAHAAEALQFIDDAVFLVDRDEVVRVWNPAAASTLGVPQAQAIGKPIAEAVEGWAALAARRAEGVAQTLPLDVRGEERWLSVSSVTFAGGTVYAARDVTEEQRVERVKNDFIATVSHELRTPLAAVYGAAITLRRPDLQLTDDERARFLDMIIAETDRLARIVNDVLWASRLEAGTIRIDIEPVDVGMLTEAVVDAARAYAPAEVELRSSVAPGLPVVSTDPDKLRQVLTNLVQNAVKYSPAGGPVDVDVDVSAPNDHVRFSVRDRGLGIAPSDQERIWKKFVRLDPNLTRGVGGTGLGLYISRELVRRLDGTIRVESDGRSGSTFVVELPVGGG